MIKQIALPNKCIDCGKDSDIHGPGGFVLLIIKDEKKLYCTECYKKLPYDGVKYTFRARRMPMMGKI